MSWLVSDIENAFIAMLF